LFLPSVDVETYGDYLDHVEVLSDV